MQPPGFLSVAKSNYHLRPSREDINTTSIVVTKNILILFYTFFQLAAF